MDREERVGATEDREAATGRPPVPKQSRLIKPPKGPTPRGDQDRPMGRRCHVEAGPGQAARPHFPASGVQPSREDQALPLHLLTTGATCINHREPTFALYK